MRLLQVLVVFSSLSFIIYGISYFTSPNMKSEFIRFGLRKLGTLTAILEILGALGLLVGLIYNSILLFSAGGLSLLMFLGVAVRIKVKDSLWVSMPVIFFFVLNLYIFYISIRIYLALGL